MHVVRLWLKWALSCGVSSGLALGLAGCGQASPPNSSGTTGTPPSTPTPNLYFPETLPTGTGAIIEVSTTVSGAVTPAVVLTDASGGLSSLVMDSSGNYYAIETTVVNGVSNWAIVEYLTGNSGTLVRRISGPATGLELPDALGVDANSNIVVGQASGSILYFNASANGNSSPTRTISGGATGVGTVLQVALGAAGQTTAANLSAAGEQLLLFPTGATGNVAPSILATFGANATIWGMTTDSAGDIFLTITSATGVNGVITSFTPTIQEFAPGATVPMRIIAPPNDGVFMAGIQVDSGGNLYVVCADLPGTTVTVQKFAVGATGAASPVATMSATEFYNTDGSLALH